MPNYAELTDQGYTTVNVNFFPWDPPPFTIPGWQQVSQAGSNFWYSDDLRTIYSINWIDTGDDLNVESDFNELTSEALADVDQGLNTGINALDPEQPPDPGPIVYDVTFTPAPEIENHDPDPDPIFSDPAPDPAPISDYVAPTPVPDPTPDPVPAYEPPPPPDPEPDPVYEAPEPDPTDFEEPPPLPLPQPDPVPVVEFSPPPIPAPAPDPTPPATMDDDDFGFDDSGGDDSGFSDFSAPPPDPGSVDFSDNSIGTLDQGLLPPTDPSFAQPASDPFGFDNNSLDLPTTDPTGLIDQTPDPTLAQFQSPDPLDFSSTIDQSVFNTSAGDFSETGNVDPFAQLPPDGSVSGNPLNFGSDFDWTGYAATLPDTSAPSTTDYVTPGGTAVSVAPDNGAPGLGNFDPSNPFSTPPATSKSSGSGSGGLPPIGGGGSSSTKSGGAAATTPAPTTTPGATKTIISQVRNGNDLVITYSDGSTQTLKNYFASGGTTGTTTTPAPAATSSLTSLLNSIFKTTGSVLGAVTAQPGAVAGKTIKSEVRNGNDLVVSYTDGSSQTIPNYYAPSSTTSTATAAAPKTVVTDQQVGADRVITYSDGSTATSPGYYTAPVGVKAAPVYKNATGQATDATGTVTGSISPMVLLAGAGVGLFLLFGNKKAA